MSRKSSESSLAVAGVESSAVSVLTRAVEHDKAERYPEALTCYQEGIQLFLNVIKLCTDETKQRSLRDKAAQYMDRAERVKELVQKQKELGKYHEHIQIAEGSTGYSYEKIFSKHLDDTVTKVEVFDAYIRYPYQIYNFLNFCELLVKSCQNLKNIVLTTGHHDQEPAKQEAHLEELKNSLARYQVVLNIIYSSTLHDREVRIDNGWIVKIGRGLDYFKNIQGYKIGITDRSLRRCNETTVDIYYSSN